MLCGSGSWSLASSLWGSTKIVIRMSDSLGGESLNYAALDGMLRVGSKRQVEQERSREREGMCGSCGQ